LKNNGKYVLFTKKLIFITNISNKNMYNKLELERMKKIMIVDDDPDQQFTIKKIMENWQYGFEFITVNNGRECLGLLERNETPDLIIMDIMMPEMSGWETYQKIKENDLWRNIPILFLTSRTDKVAKNAGSFLGDGFIEKPIDFEEFIQIIEKILK
jgi:CheY-like chemotaxis protein